MARGRKLQLQLIDDIADNLTANVADRVIDLTAELKVVKEKLEIQEKNLLGLLKKAKKIQVRHRGMLIKVKFTESKEKLVIKGKKNTKDQKDIAAQGKTTASKN
jgi:hypothetical protein